jgi:hypothetical protein
MAPDEQVLDDTENGDEAPAPKVMPGAPAEAGGVLGMASMAEVPVLVTVTVCAVLVTPTGTDPKVDEEIETVAVFWPKAATAARGRIPTTLTAAFNMDWK